jgi:S-DNA-T family DNA segregation ATPase FtsK/SpoIIIE
MGVRNLAGFNAKLDEAKARGEFIGNPFSLTPEAARAAGQRLPHIVVVIDELADLMMVVGKKIEELIARLAQKGPCGWHSPDSGYPAPQRGRDHWPDQGQHPHAHFAFQVSSKIDSRTILDQMGAEALLGMGDMLYMASGTGLPGAGARRVRVSDEEVHRVVGLPEGAGWRAGLHRWGAGRRHS